MKKEYYNEQNGLYYKLGEDGLYYPQIVMKQRGDRVLGKYGRMRKRFLEQEHYPVFAHLLLSDTLYEHLQEVDDKANKMLEVVIKELSEADGCDEKMKMQEQMKWVGLMNNYHACAEEIVLKELIYR